MTTDRTKGVTVRAKGNVRLVAAQRDDGDGNPTEEYLLLRSDQFGQLQMTGEADMTTGRTKGVTERAIGDVVLVAAQRDDAAGNPTEQYLILRADENGRLRTVGAATGTNLFPQIDDLGDTTWGVPGWIWGGIGDTFIGANRVYYVPMYVERSRTFTQIGIHVTGTVGAGNARIGIYAATFDDDGDLTPDTLILDAGTVDISTTGQKSIAISQTLAEGFYFLAVSCDVAPNLARPGSSNPLTLPFTGRHGVINGESSAVTSIDVVDGAAALTDPATSPDTRELEELCFVQIGE